MQRSLIVLAALTLISLIWSADFSAKSLGVEIAEMKGLLSDEAKIPDFITRYMSPTDRERILKQAGSMETVAKKFVEKGKHVELAKTLAEFSEKTCTVDDEKKSISFTPSNSNGRPIVFLFIDETWYLKN